MQIIIIFLLLLPMSLITQAYAEEIITTLSRDTDKIIYDGKWTYRAEWKPTALTEVKYDDGSTVIIRTGHDYENLYVFLDFVSDRFVQKHNDKAMVCIDKSAEHANKPNPTTYCFIAVIGIKEPHTLQGDGRLAGTGFWKKIENNPDFIAIGGVSDENDRYSKIPHASYEFKIPLEVIGRSNIYSFYAGVVDGKTGVMYSWPQNAHAEKYPFIPTPNTWGDLISPDKSIPEFNVPIFILILTLAITVFLRNTKTKLKFFNHF